MDKALVGLKEVMAAVVVVGAAVTAALTGVTLAAAEAGDAAAKGAVRTATQVEKYQELAFAADQSSLSVEQLEQGLTKTTKAVADLAEGTGPAAEALADLGLESEDLADLSTDEQFKLIADSLVGVTDEQERLRIAQGIYGEELAGKLMPLLSLGSEGMDELGQLAHDLGIIMSEEDTAAATEFSDTLAQLWGFLKGLVNTIGADLLPIITEVMAGFREWAIANREVIASGIERWMNVVVEAIDGAVNVITTITDALGGLGNVLKFLGGLLAGLFALIALSQPIIAGWVAIFVGAALVIEDLIVFFQGGDSALGRFLDRFRESEGVLGSVARTIEAIIAVGTRLFDVMVQLGAIFQAVFERTALPVLQLLWAAFVRVAEEGLGLMAAFWDSVLGPAVDLMLLGLDFLIAKLQAAMPIIEGVLGALDTGLGVISKLTGVELGVGGEEGAPPAGGAAGAVESLAGGFEEAAGATGFDTTAFAPTPAPAAAGAAAGPTNVTVEGSPVTFNGIGMSIDEAKALIAEMESERNRQVSAALEGAEV